MVLLRSSLPERANGTGAALVTSTYIVWTSDSSMLTFPYRLTFTSSAVAGKTMIVQATNTGGDLGENHFDLAIAGGGVGLFNGCSRQWGGIDLGKQNGGFTDRSQYATVPWQWQQACYWRFDWFRNADNPNVQFEEVSCPQAMIDRTGCGRWS